MTAPSFLEVFKVIILKLEDKNIEYMIVGSIASMIYGEPRLTKDLDVVIQLDLPQSKYLTAMFPDDSFYVPPTEILNQEVLNRGQFNVLHIPSGLKVDFMMRKNSPHGICEFGRRRRVPFIEGMDVWIAAPEDVIIKKLAYYNEGRSEKHISDIKSILVHTEVDLTYIDSWVQRLGLAECYEVVKKS